MIFPEIILMDGPICDIGSGSSSELSVPLRRFIYLLETTFETSLHISTVALACSSAEGKFQALVQVLKDMPNLPMDGLLVLHSNRDLVATAKRLESEWHRISQESGSLDYEYRRMLFVGSCRRLSETGSDAPIRIVHALSAFDRLSSGVSIVASNGNIVQHERARYNEPTGKIIELPWTAPASPTTML